VRVEVARSGTTAARATQCVYEVGQNDKTPLLLSLLASGEESTLVFTRTKRRADKLTKSLEKAGHEVERIHANRSQSQRKYALDGFKSGKFRVLVATDIAARGIDVESISHVINYDVPTAPEDYVHRIGRTGRAGKTGRAITLVTPVDELSMRAIERLTGQPVERVVLPSFGGAPAVTQRAAVKPFRPMRGSGSSTRRSFRPRRAGR